YDDVISESLSTLKDTVMWAVLLALLTSLLAGFILTNSLRPLKRLATAMTNLSTGKDVDFHLPTFQQDEVGLLSRNFVQMAGEINKAKNELEKSNQQLEDRVEIRTRELKESETKQRIILENMIDGLITTDKNYHILSLNIAAEKMFMYKAEEIIGQSFDILLNTDALRPPATQSEQNLIFSLHSLVGNFQRIVGRRKDGKTFNLDVAVSQALIDGRPILTVLTRDVTQLTKAENEILRAKNEAETANLAKSEFLSSMSHELRTPMNAIIGFSQLLQMGDDESPLTEQQKSNVDEIYVAGQHLLDLINEILDLSRIEAGHIALSLESVALDSVLVECLNLINPLATKRNIKISVLIQGKSINVSDIQNDRHFLFADRIRLKQVILNLLSNAVKYNRDNGSITINCERQKEKQLRISITDTGLGLNEEKQNELFQAFNRLGAERTEIEGTGVGLVISKRIIELMSGSIGANSTQNVGSTFWIQLPLDKTETSENNKNLHSTHKDLSSNNPVVTGQYTALYIEDNPANIRLVEQVLLSRPQITLIASKSP
ncbi:MAG: ATP-binding protein, partial [Gammaproteobacteria bacterium]|nr:ATP-binding protein [Gammaproteobacteria bacterium]